MTIAALARSCRNGYLLTNFTATVTSLTLVDFCIGERTRFSETQWTIFGTINRVEINCTVTVSFGFITIIFKCQRRNHTLKVSVLDVIGIVIHCNKPVIGTGAAFDKMTAEIDKDLFSVFEVNLNPSRTGTYGKWVRLRKLVSEFVFFIRIPLRNYVIFSFVFNSGTI